MKLSGLRLALSKKARRCENTECGKKYTPRSQRQRVCGSDECNAWLKAQAAAKIDGVLERNKYMDEDERKIFFATLDKAGDRWRILYRLMINACLRIGEVGFLTPSDFEVEGSLSTVYVTTLKKKGRPRLPVDVDEQTVKEVLAFTKKQKMKPGERIWKIGVQQIRAEFRNILKVSGIKRRLVPHCLRHTGILMRAAAARAVEDLEWVRRSARHSSIEMTMVYLHTTSKRRKELVRKVDWV